MFILNITWEMLDRYQLTWDDLDAIGLTWAELEELSNDAIFDLAKQRIPKYKVSEAEAPKDYESIIQNIYLQFPLVPKEQQKKTTKALQFLGQTILAWAIGKALENSAEVVSALLKIMSILSTLSGE